jgi:hypothetical protein
MGKFLLSFDKKRKLIIFLKELEVVEQVEPFFYYLQTLEYLTLLMRMHEEEIQVDQTITRALEEVVEGDILSSVIPVDQVLL